MVSTYRELDKVCKALGLTCKEIKKGHLWGGLLGDNYVRIIVHTHNEGRDIATGLLRNYIKQLGFKSEQEYYDYIKTIILSQVEENTQN